MPRLPYFPPRLTRFGTVASLTQAISCAAKNDGVGACSVGGVSDMAMASDRRMKQDIVHIGDHPDGFGLYLFNYLPAHRDECGHARQFGVMADEVERMAPQAVGVRADGLRYVRYGLIGIQLAPRRDASSS